MSILDWQLAIYNRLRRGLPGTLVFLEGVPENSSLPKDPTGLIKPLVILWFGQLSDEETRFDHTPVRGLCDEGGGEDEGVKSGSLLVTSIAPSGLAILQLENRVRDLLTGFSPAGHGALSETGTSTVRDPFPAGIGDTLRMYKPVFFSGTVTNRDLPVTGGS